MSAMASVPGTWSIGAPAGTAPQYPAAAPQYPGTAPQVYSMGLLPTMAAAPPVTIAAPYLGTTSWNPGAVYPPPSITDPSRREGDFDAIGDMYSDEESVPPEPREEAEGQAYFNIGDGGHSPGHARYAWTVGLAGSEF